MKTNERNACILRIQYDKFMNRKLLSARVNNHYRSQYAKMTSSFSENMRLMYALYLAVMSNTIIDITHGDGYIKDINEDSFSFVIVSNSFKPIEFDKFASIMESEYLEYVTKINKNKKDGLNNNS